MTRTGPMNRYPLPITVSRKRGFAASSPKALRIFRTMLLMFRSVSMKRSECQSCGHDVLAGNQLLSSRGPGKSKAPWVFSRVLTRATQTAKFVATQVELNIGQFSGRGKERILMDKPIVTSSLRRYTKNIQKLFQAY